MWPSYSKERASLLTGDLEISLTIEKCDNNNNANSSNYIHIHLYIYIQKFILVINGNSKASDIPRLTCKGRENA